MCRRPKMPTAASMFLTFVLLAASISANELQTTSGHALDLDACVRIATSENPILRAAEEGVAAAAQSVGVARSAYYPEVRVGARYRRFDTHLFLPSELSQAGGTLGATDDWSAGLWVGYTMYDGGVRRAASDAAIANREAAAHSREKTRQEVVLGVHHSYFRALSAEASDLAAESRVARASEHLELAQARKEAGAVPHADVLRAQVEAGAARLAQVQAEAEKSIAYGDLATAMGLPADLPISIVSDSSEIQDSTIGDVEAAIRRALTQRAELKGARERITAAEHKTAAIEGSYRPQLRAEMALGLRDSEFFPEDPDWSVGASVKIPIFSGFAKTHRVEQAATEVRILEAETEALANRIRQEVWTASHHVANAEEAVRQSTKLRAEAEKSLEFTRARYEAGAGTINDLLDAESALTEADAAQVAATLSYRVARSSHLQAQGAL